MTVLACLLESVRPMASFSRSLAIASVLSLGVASDIHGAGTWQEGQPYESPMEPPCATHNVGYLAYNQSLNKVWVSTSVQCYALCSSQQPHCIGYTWRETDSACFLQDSAWPTGASTVPIPGIVTGPVPCDWSKNMKPDHYASAHDPPCAITDMGYVAPIDTVPPPQFLWLATPRACWWLCHVQPFCDYYTWNETSGMCFILNSTGLKYETTLPGIVGGKPVMENAPGGCPPAPSMGSIGTGPVPTLPPVKPVIFGGQAQAAQVTSSGDSGGLSGGIIALIVGGVIVAVAAAVAGIYAYQSAAKGSKDGALIQADEEEDLN